MSTTATTATTEPCGSPILHSEPCSAPSALVVRWVESDPKRRWSFSGERTYCRRHAHALLRTLRADPQVTDLGVA